jgi:RNA polymerase sigma-70 factor (ECF subfamily)
MTIERLRQGAVREPERLASFVLGMCRLVVLDLRRGGRRRERALQQFGGDLPSPAPAGPPLDTERLTTCLERLSARERGVLVLTFQSDRSASEVGQELGLTPANVRVIRHRALARLRACMNGEELRP